MKVMRLSKFKLDRAMKKTKDSRYNLFSSKSSMRMNSENDKQSLIDAFNERVTVTQNYCDSILR